MGHFVEALQLAQVVVDERQKQSSGVVALVAVAGGAVVETQVVWKTGALGGDSEIETSGCFAFSF